MRHFILVAGMVAAMAPAMPALAKNHHKHHNENYYADRHYRDGKYSERRLSRNDRVYRGGDGRYYCKRKDGTTGLIVGGVAGGLLGNTIAPGGSKTLGTILGGAGGAILGKSLDDGVKCR